MIRKVALAATLVQAAITAALATQLFLNDQAGGDPPTTIALNVTAQVPAIDRRPLHTILVLNPNE
jgi:hypothetical protein